jgi:thioredoxin 1
MKPILKNLAVEYEGKVNIVFLDVYDDAEPTSRYGIQLVPTQIIFDSNGEELGRHVGFWPKESIIAVFQEMGIE